MDYPRYRRKGLPLTSSHIDSTVKLINRRIKGSEKFWERSSGEAVLQLRADFLSDSRPLEEFSRRWQAQQTGSNRYRAAAKVRRQPGRSPRFLFDLRFREGGLACGWGSGALRTCELLKARADKGRAKRSLGSGNVPRSPPKTGSAPIATLLFSYAEGPKEANRAAGNPLFRVNFAESWKTLGAECQERGASGILRTE